ncbi:MAG: helix-turn-helix domain-containing protein [Clostridiales bacterium]|jgi:transcriptional regulator with XRE-family HTH domain|nr:helix-turn-helix domain-containing protein [Clostridiales bacterium]
MNKQKLRTIIGMNIRNERMARNMSMDELAELLELSSGFVGLIERGKRGATSLTLHKLADVFGTTVDNIFYGAEGSLSLREEPESRTKTMRAKVSSLIADLTEPEMEFVIRIIKGIKRMNHTIVIRDDEEDDDE